MAFLSATFKRLNQALHIRQKAFAALRLTPLRILQPGEILYTSGDEGDFLAVISKGIMKYDQSSFERTVGDLIYDLDESGRRTRTVKSLTAVRLFVWKISDLDEKLLSEIRPLIVHSSIKSSLLKSTLFDGLASEQIDGLCDIVHWKSADVNEVVIKEGNQSQSLYIVDRGLLRCYTGSETDLEHQMMLGNITPGDYIGEIALLIGIPRTASAVAVKPTSLMEIRATDFAHLVQLDPRIGKQIRNRIHTRLIMQFRQYKCTFFESLTDDQVQDLGPRCNLQYVPNDTVLFRVGDAGDLFYMIAFGQVQLQLYNNDMTVSTETLLSAGSYFGELAIRHDTPRYGSAKTLSPCLFLTLSRAEFSNLFKEQQMPVFARLPSSVDDLISVWRLLQTESGFNLLTLFSSKRIAPDMLAFWLECEAFRKAAETVKQEEVVEAAKSIISTYLAESASKNVGLPKIVKDQLIEIIQKNDQIDGNIFNMARFVIARIVTVEVFPYLKHSDLYKEFAGDGTNSRPSVSENIDEKPLLQAPPSFNLEAMS